MASLGRYVNRLADALEVALTKFQDAQVAVESISDMEMRLGLEILIMRNMHVVSASVSGLLQELSAAGDLTALLNEPGGGIASPFRCRIVPADRAKSATHGAKD